MTRNMGTTDRLLRAFVLGLAALVAALAVGGGTLPGILLLVVGAVMFATAAVGFCPLYKVLGISTRRHDSSPRAA
jgi:hypothetical protein